jgi:thiamine pyrophosphokinase
MKDNKIITRFQSKLTASLEVMILGPLPLEKDHNKDLIPQIFVDGGIGHQKEIKLSKDHISIGDGDSAQNQKLNFTVSRIKNYSDLALALKIVGHRCQTIYLNGFIASNTIENRYDHFLANLGESYQWSKVYKGFIWLNSHFVILPKGIHHFFHQGPFSLLSIEETDIKIEGEIEYHVLQNIKLKPMSSQGISNKAFGNVIITINRPILLILDWGKS